MKKILLPFFFLFAGLQLHAQDSLFPYTAGGFGHFFIGPGFFSSQKITDYLGKSDVLHTNIPFRPGNISGGEGFGLLGRFIVGGGGFGNNLMRTSTDSARLDVGFGGGYFKFGYVFHYTRGNFTYLYGGVGWGAMNVRIENLASETDIRFNHQHPIAPGQKGDYTLGLTWYDVGVSYKRLFSAAREPEGDGGFMAGIDLGCLIAVPNSDWENDNTTEVVSGPPVPAGMLSPYIRLTIGGGGFGRR